MAGRGRHGERQRGQVVILFALALIFILGMVSIAIDGGFGLVQARRAQNGADFASVAGARMLASLCQGGIAPSNALINQEMQDVIDRNATDVGTNWTGTYLDGSGVVIPNGAGGYYTTGDPGYAPGAACGVTVTLRPNWQPYFAQAIGQSTQKTQANAKSVYKANKGTGAGIVALDEVSPHQVLGGGKGKFNVFGTIFANSTVPYDPWGSNHNGVRYVDVVDAKGDSNLTLHGDMQTVGGSWPLDWCFGVDAAGKDLKPGGPAPYNTDPPPNQPPCNDGGSKPAVTPLIYDHIRTGYPTLPDPLGAGGSGLADPFDKTSPSPGFTQGLCSGKTQPASIGVLPAEVGGVTTLLPGDYTIPVILPDSAHPSGNVDLADCSGIYESDPNTITVYPGVFRFEKGVSFKPPSGATVRGNNVMVATKDPVPVPGNVPGTVTSGVFSATGTGNGAPCFPEPLDGNGDPQPVVSSGGWKETDGTHACGGTIVPGGQYFGVRTRSQVWNFPQDANVYGSGNNFSLILGGAGTIKFSAPTTGPFKDIALFQNRSTPGNFGLNGTPSDSANILIDSFNGSAVVYNVSLPCRGYPIYNGSCTTSSNYKNLVPNNPFDFWDDGTTFHTGGTMQAGAGTGTHPYPSAGTVTVKGPCVVEDFNTDGNTTITIDGLQNKYLLPGVISSGNPPIVG